MKEEEKKCLYGSQKMMYRGRRSRSEEVSAWGESIASMGPECRNGEFPQAHLGNEIFTLSDSHSITKKETV